VTDQLPAVTLGGISKTYRNAHIPAVADVSLEIQEGEVLSLLGPSGCGKSTTLRIIAGLEVPDSGVIRFRDRTIVDVSRRVVVPANRRNVGMVFQSYAIWPHMTVAENVAYPLKVRRVPKAQIRERVARALELVGLGGLEDRPAPMLSGGQQQRVAVARALTYEPSILLLDEPFSNLDAALREQMRMELKLLQSRINVTILFVTHDQVEALSLSDRVAVMQAGYIRQIGTPRELYERPADAYVRDFLGKTALFRGVVEDLVEDGAVDVRLDGSASSAVRGRAGEAAEFARGSRVTLAVRPEHLRLRRVDASPVAAEDVLGVGEVQATLFVGERTEYRIAVDQQDPVLVHGRPDEPFGTGDRVEIRLEPGRATVWHQP
jgi:iron(III) transport system ATP-binding protein